VEIPCFFEHEHEQSALQLPRDLSTALFRIAQEALTNVARHAHAAQVRVRLECYSDQIKLVVRDDGVGIRPADLSDPHAFGLIGMRERLYPWQGVLDIVGGKDKGTTVTVIVPTSKGENHEHSRVTG
jgi:signal transduction histidine kinase